MKRKGGAEKVREKKKRLLETEAQKCQSLDNLFKKKNINQINEKDSENNIFIGGASSHAIENSPSSCAEVTEVIICSVGEKPNEAYQVNSQTIALEMDCFNDFNYDFFIPPNFDELNLYFNYHPKIPKESKDVLFNIKKAFEHNNGTPRKWLSYSYEKKALFCTVCLAFSNKSQESAFKNGMCDWKHVYQRISEHECSSMHKSSCEAYFMHGKDRNIDKLIANEYLTKRNTEVMKNRQVLDRVINVIKLIGKRGLAYRSHINESAYCLSDETQDHGNFLEIIMLLSKYDIILKNHLNKIISQSQRYKEQGAKQRQGNFLTFVSKSTVNTIISLMTASIKKQISTEVASATMFSIEIDTTQDISVTDQCSLVIRYVYNQTVFERLLAVIPCYDTSGQGFHDLIAMEINKNGLQMENCVADSTDGAANMQGEFNGFAAKMLMENKHHVHIWCHSHILNLVIGDILKSDVKVATFFALLNSVAQFFKESYKRMQIWNTVSHDIKKRRLQVIGETRWWAKELALSKIFGSSDNFETSLYPDLIEALDTVEENRKIKSDIRVTAKNYKEGLLKYENLLIAHIFIKIFSITGPLSRYLQTEGLDFLKCTTMVQTALKQLQTAQRSMHDLLKKTNNFVSWVKLELLKRELDIELETEFPEKRRRTVKTFFDEKCRDERPKTSGDEFRVFTFNYIMDTTIESMNKRFKKNMDLCKDLAILNPLNFSDIRISGVPAESLNALSKKLIPFNSSATPEALSEELHSFAGNWDSFKLTLNQFYGAIPADEEDDDYENPLSKSICQRCLNCAVCCYQTIMKYNMYQGAYPSLATAYKYLLTLPISQVACERTFSILKYIKNRLRNSLSNERLESFMLMNLERSILPEIDNEDIINKLAATSPLLTRSLIY